MIVLRVICLRAGGTARAVALLFDGAAFGAHPVGPTGRVTSLLVRRVAVGTLERLAQPAPAPLLGHDPLAPLPRGTVTHVLAVAALEERHPLPHPVLFEADHAAPHGVSLIAVRPRLRRSLRMGGAPDRPSTRFIATR